MGLFSPDGQVMDYPSNFLYEHNLIILGAPKSDEKFHLEFRWEGVYTA